MSAAPVRKLLISAGHYFGPGSGLGALMYLPLGEQRPILGTTLRLPIRLPAPFLWELHLTADLPCQVEVALTAAPGAPGLAALSPGRRSEVIGVTTPSRGDPALALDFTLMRKDGGSGGLHFLGLSLLSLQDFVSSPAGRAS